MRILQFVPYYSPARGFGGPPIVAENLSDEFIRQGHSVVVFTSDSCNEDGQISCQDVKTEQLTIRYFKTVFPRYWKRVTGLVRPSKSAIREADIVIIHTVFSFFTWISLRLCARSKKPFLLFAHGMFDRSALDKNSFVKKAYLSIFVRPYLRHGTVVFNADEERDNSIFSANSLVIGNAINLGDFIGQKSLYFKSNFPDLVGKRIFLFLGRLDPKKGLDILVEGFSEFAKECPDVHLAIVGVDYLGYRSKLEKIIQDINSSGFIKFYGGLYGEEKLNALAEAYAFVQPSYYEGLSISLLEAMATALPIITTDKVGLHGLLSQRNAGCIISPEKKELVEALRHLYFDPEMAGEMGRKAQELIKESFTWNKIVTKIIYSHENRNL